MYIANDIPKWNLWKGDEVKVHKTLSETPVIKSISKKDSKQLFPVSSIDLTDTNPGKSIIEKTKRR